MKTFASENLQQTDLAARAIAAMLTLPSCVYIEGGMGAGKTTLCKSIISELGYSGVVTSPTYNLIHEYPIKTGTIYHLDLYRVQDPQELECLAIADLWQQDSLFLIEWPSRAEQGLPEPTHSISIELGHRRDVECREIKIWQT